MDRSAVRVLTAAAALCAALFACAPAAAQEAGGQMLAVGPAPVIRIQARSADLTVRTWDRPEVQISSAAALLTQRFGPQAVARALPGGDVPIFATEVQTRQGPLRLQQEDFPVDGIAGVPHGGIIIFGGDTNAVITVTVPASSALLLANVGRGGIHVSDFHTAMVVRLHNGTVEVNNSGGEAYLESARGNVIVSKSTFNRVRTRTAVGNVLFSGCNVRQIEASSIHGHIVYDDGTFSPGLARFETQEGNIALGVGAGGLQIGAHSSNGRIISSFDRGAGVVTGSQTDAQATVNGGGPVVTVNAGKGSVFLYSGSLKNKPHMQQGWNAAHPPITPPRARTCAGRRCRP